MKKPPFLRIYEPSTGSKQIILLKKRVKSVEKLIGYLKKKVRLENDDSRKLLKRRKFKLLYDGYSLPKKFELKYLEKNALLTILINTDEVDNLAQAVDLVRSVGKSKSSTKDSVEIRQKAVSEKEKKENVNRYEDDVFRAETVYQYVPEGGDQVMYEPANSEKYDSECDNGVVDYDSLNGNEYPEVNSRIVFKVWEISVDCTPELSREKSGRVVGVDYRTGMVRVQLDAPRIENRDMVKKKKKRGLNKFMLDDENVCDEICEWNINEFVELKVARER
ncbi:hypothetical protein ROZALSC1DRAFT_27766, partial [Rozella allomycis CSF55]